MQWWAQRKGTCKSWTLEHPTPRTPLQRTLDRYDYAAHASLSIHIHMLEDEVRFATVLCKEWALKSYEDLTLCTSYSVAAPAV